MEATGWFRPLNETVFGSRIRSEMRWKPRLFFTCNKKVCFSCAFKNNSKSSGFFCGNPGSTNYGNLWDMVEVILFILGKFTQHPRILEWSPWALVPVSCNYGLVRRKARWVSHSVEPTSIQTRNLGLQLPRDWVEMWVWLKLFIP